MSCCASCGAKTKGALIMAIFHMTVKLPQLQKSITYNVKINIRILRKQKTLFFRQKKIFLLGQKMHETFLLNWINKNYPKKKKSVLTSLVKIEM